MRTRVLSLAAVALLVMCGTVHAHGFAVYLSTPVSPPKGYQWVFYCSIPLLVAAATLSMRLSGRRWRSALWRSSVAVTMSAWLFYEVGRIAAEANTGPPPGLGWAGRPFWGAKWNWIPELFLSWNALGVLFLAPSVALLDSWEQVVRGRKRALAIGIVLAFVYVHLLAWTFQGLWWLHLTVLAAAGAALVIRRRKGAWPLLCVTVVYAACLVPYLASGAIAHGWAGGYVASHCDDKIRLLRQAAIRYALHHEGRLPSAKTNAEFLDAVRPYLKLPGDMDEKDLLVCRAGAAFEAHPEPLRWNAEFAGKSIAELSKLEEPPRLIVCPYALRGYHADGRVFLQPTAEEYREILLERE